jgi:hypothetical protein
MLPTSPFPPRMRAPRPSRRLDAAAWIHGALRVVLACLALAAGGQAAAQGILGASMAFEPSTIAPGQLALLRITLDNTGSSSTTRGVGYEVNFPSGMRLAEAPSDKQCGGRVRYDTYGYSFRLRRMPAGLVCSIYVAVTVDGTAARVFTQLVGPIRARNAAGVSQLSALLSVNGAPPPVDGSRVDTTLAVTLSPTPVVEGQVLTVSAKVGSAHGAPDGVVQAWIAGAGSRCPEPFEGGNAPVTTITSTATLAGGNAQFAFPGLPVGAFRACVRYAGTATFVPSTQGPVDVFVIKGVLF